MVGLANLVPIICPVSCQSGPFVELEIFDQMVGKHKTENFSKASERHLQHSILGQVYKKQRFYLVI